MLFDQNYFHFLSSVWNFPVQCSLKGPFSSSFLSACKKGTFVLPLQQHFCIIVFLVFWFYLTFAVGDLFHEALEFVISSLSFSFYFFVLPCQRFQLLMYLYRFTNLHNTLSNKNIYLCVWLIFRKKEREKVYPNLHQLFYCICFGWFLLTSIGCCVWLEKSQ